MLLKDAVVHGESFFIKVHAAENLIFHNRPDGLDSAFLSLQRASPDHITGSARVMARLCTHHPERYNGFLGQLLLQFKEGGSRRISLTALESLAKLGYQAPLPEIRALADTGSQGFKAMARWVLANSKTEATENRLSALLRSNNIFDYRYAAYALRFKEKTNRLTIKRLNKCLERLAPDDDARVYVAAGLFVHSSGHMKRQAKQVLLSYLRGNEAQRYELAEALGTGGNETDLSTLQELFTDESTDVRVAAANARMRIVNCQKVL